MRSLILALSLLVLLAFAPVPQGRASSSAPFTVVGATWGTAAKAVEAAPGGANVPLTVTVEFQGSLEALSVTGLLHLGSATTNQEPAPGLTDIYGNSTASASAFSVNPGETFTLSYLVDIANTTKVGSFSIPMELRWTDSTTGSGGYDAQSASASVTVLGIPDLVYRASPLALVPGRVNNVSLTVSNVGSGTASQISISDTAAGVSVLNPVFFVSSLSPGRSKSMAVGIYVPASLSASSVTLAVTTAYTDSYGNAQSGSQSLGMYTDRVPAPILSFEALTTAIAAGQSNTVQISLTNLGSGTASNIHVQITSSGQSSVLNQFPLVASLGPNSSANADIGIYAPQSLAGSPFTLTIVSSYTDEFGNAGTYTQTLGLYVANSTASLPTTLLSVTPVKSSVRVGTESTVAFMVENAGSTPLTTPVLSLGVSSPLVVTQNSTYAVKGGVLRPGESVLYEAVVGAGTGSTPGFYSVSVGISYLDSSGTLKSAVFSSGLVLSGAVDLVVQSPAVAQGNTTVVVSGSILNEGFTSAYYGSVTGALAAGRAPSPADYVGEVDPNTPIPFSVTINYIPQATPNLKSNVTISITYTDSLGISGKYTVTVPVTLKSAAQLQQSQGSGSASASSGSDLLTYLEYGVVVGLAVIACVGAVYIRRSRRHSAGGEEDADRKADHEVI